MHYRLKHKYLTNFIGEFRNNRLEVYFVNTDSKKSTFAEDVKDGLTSANKFLLPKYFYDIRGSDLFEKICSTDEYYVTRTEAEILQNFSDEIACVNEGKELLVELGSGSSIKTEYIIDAFLRSRRHLVYAPIDVSYMAVQTAKRLIQNFDELKISGIIGEYESGLELITHLYDHSRLIIFLGSSIGNFDFDQAKQFVSFIGSKIGKIDSLLIGFDMRKDANVLNAAYNDSAGYTAEFNLNLLRRINDEMQANFDIDKFEHLSFFNDEESRIEMHIVSLADQEVCIDSINSTIRFRKGERIHTENSYKFTDEMIKELADYAGLQVTKCWQDKKKYFSLCLFNLQ